MLCEEVIAYNPHQQNMNLYNRWILAYRCDQRDAYNEGYTVHPSFEKFMECLGKMAQNTTNIGPFDNKLTMNMDILTNNIDHGAFDNWFATACKNCQQQPTKATEEINIDVKLKAALGSQLPMLANVCYIGEESREKWPILTIDKIDTSIQNNLT